MTIEGLSMLGTRMTSLAFAIWVYQTTHQTTPILWIALCNELPAMLAGSLAGVWVDRFPKRLVLLLSDAGQAVMSAVLIISFWLGFFHLWLLYAVVFVQGICAMFQGPASQTVVSMMANDEQRDRVNGIREMLFPLAGIIGPALVGLLYGPLGLSGIIVVDCITFLLSTAFLLSVRLPDEVRGATDAGEIEPSGDLGGVLGGIRFLVRHRLLGLAAYIGGINFLLNGTLEMVVPYVSGISGEVGGGMSFVLICMNAGAAAGAFAVALIGRFRNRIRVMTAGYVLTGLMFIVFGMVKQPVWQGIVLFLLMIPLPAGGSLVSSHFQTVVPAAVQGRVFAFLHQINVASAVLSFTLMGPLVDRILQPASGGKELAWLLPIVGVSDVFGIAVLYIAAGSVMIGVTLAVLYFRRKIS
jgi:MFS transporter, DHA3 family, macrolide efflux protein